MSKRPDNVRCETCVFWDSVRKAFGQCKRHAPTYKPEENGGEVWTETYQTDWCGEWRDEWPKT